MFVTGVVGGILRTLGGPALRLIQLHSTEWRMRLELTDEQKQVQDTMRSFAADEIAPVARELDGDDKYPKAIMEDLAEMGVMGMTIPQGYGGLGYNLVTYAVAVEELAAALASVAGAVNTHLIVATLLQRYGSSDLRAEFLEDLATYDTVSAFGLTEPNAGSDNTAIETKAWREGDEWVLSGQKQWVTNALNSDLIAIFAKTGSEADKYRNISAFLVPSNVDGLEISDRWETLGMNTIPTSDVYLDDVRIPSRYLIGERNQGFMYVVKGLNVGRISHAARSVGMARAALDDAIEYALDREQFGHPIGEFQGIQFKIADMAMRTETARLHTYRAAYLAEKGTLERGLETSMAKVVASEAAVENALEAIQIHGGMGYTKEYDVERYLRDAKLQTITEGTNEIQRRLIADRLLDR